MSTDRGRVLVTGLGVVSAFGRGLEALWRSLRDGTPAASAVCEDYHPPSNLDSDALAALERRSLLAADAAIQAVEDAGLPFTAQTAPLIAVVLGSGGGELAASEPPATSVARVLGVAGPVLSLSGRGSGLAALVEGFELIKRGAAPVVVVGAVDLLPEGNTEGGSSRPFDADRSGPRPAEASCALVLEDAEIATTRGARVYAEVLGGGMAFSRATAMDPAPNFVDAARAMRAALLRAEVFQGEVEAVFACANGDPAGDEVEVRALKDLWGPNVDRLTVTSIHGATGHAASSGGLLSLLAAIKAMNEGLFPASAGCERPDDAFSALDIVTGKARAWRFTTAMINDFSEGTNVSVVVRQSA